MKVEVVEPTGVNEHWFVVGYRCLESFETVKDHWLTLNFPGRVVERVDFQYETATVYLRAREEE